MTIASRSHRWSGGAWAAGDDSQVVLAGVYAIEYEVLGPFRVRAAGREVSVAGSLTRTLGAALLSRPDESVSVSVLLDALWPRELVAGAERKLQVLVSRLRQALGDRDRIVFEPDGYRLRVLPGELDADRFESLLDEAADAADAEPTVSADLSRKALGLWRGEPFGGVDNPVIADEVRRLEERRLAGYETLFAAELACGRDAAIVGELIVLAGQHPLRERFHALLMTALYRSGRQAEALRVYRDARVTFVEELGLEPGVELRELQRVILAGERIGSGSPTVRESPTPSQLPADTGGFVAREAELAELDGMLTDPERWPIAAVTGTAGVGKTSLAVHWAHRVRGEFPDGHLYVDLRGYDPQPPLTSSEVLGRFLVALGVPEPAIPAEQDDRASLFRSTVASRRLMIVLDNARSADQVRPLLAGTPSCAVLITSRDSLASLVAREGVHRITLDVFTTAQAGRLLRAVLGRDIDPDSPSTAAMIERCAHLPLALRLAAELIARHRAASDDQSLTMLDDRYGLLDTLDDDDPRAAVRTVFGWSYERLSPEAARLFRLIGLYPGRRPDLHALAALANEPVRTARRSLATLVRAHLVTEPAPGMFQLHDLLHDYATELAHTVDSDTDRHATRTRIYDYTLAATTAAIEVLAPVEYFERPAVRPVSTELPGFADAGAARRWLHGQHGDLVESAVDAAGHGRGDMTAIVSLLLYRYFDLYGHHDDALRLHTAARDAAAARGDRLAEAHATRFASGAFMRSWQLDTALQLGEQAYVAYHDVGASRYERMQLHNLGAICNQRCDYHAALDFYRRALDLFEPTSERLHRLTAMAGAAKSMMRLGRYEEARGYLGEVLRSDESDCSPHIKASAQIRLAETLRLLGRYTEAVQYYGPVLAFAEESGDLLVMEDLSEFAPSFMHLGRRDDALAIIERALAASRTRSGRPAAVVLNDAGEAYRLNDDLDKAQEFFLEARVAATERREPWDAAIATEGLGDVAADRANHQQSQALRGAALTAFRELRLRPDIDRLEEKLATGLTS